MSEDLEEKTKKEEPKLKKKIKSLSIWLVDLFLAIIIGGAVINYYSPKVVSTKNSVDIYDKNLFKEDIYYFANEDGTETIQTLSRHLNVIYRDYNDPNNTGEFKNITIGFRKYKNPGFFLIPDNEKDPYTKNYKRWADKGRKYLKNCRQKYQYEIPFKKIQARIKK